LDLCTAIDIRTSRRSYLDAPIDPNAIAALEREIEAINKQSGLNIAFLENGSAAFHGFLKNYGLFSGVRSVIVLKGRRNDADLKEKVGYYGERLVLLATCMGLGTCWVGGSFDRKNDVFQLDEGEKMVCVVTVGKVEQGKSNKEKLVYWLTHRNTKTIDQMLLSDTAPPEWVRRGMEAVQKAPSAANAQPVKLEYKSGLVTAYVKDNALAMVDLGIAKLHFELLAGGQFEMGNYGVFHKL